MEADLHRFYGLDLVDAYRGTISIRKLAVLAIHLPPEAAVKRQGMDDEWWSRETQASVAVLDQIRALRHQIAGEKHPIDPTPRPSDAARAQTRADRILERARRWEKRRINRG